jgi:hypothetical protein
MFAASFLRIRSHPRHPCYWLILPTVKRIQDFHLIADTHAWRTKKASEVNTAGAFCNTMFSDTASEVTAIFYKVFCSGFEKMATDVNGCCLPVCKCLAASRP